MKVELLHCTPLSLASRAAKICIGADEPDGWTDTDRAEFLCRLISKGHESVIEHVTMSFLVEGLSRACLQQLARHRHVSLSVKSTRWALGKHADWKLHEGLPAGHSAAVVRYMEGALDLVEELRQAFGNDVAKYYLPECVTTDLVLTLNLRELRHIYRLRTAPNAMEEFRELCRDLVAQLPGDVARLVAL